MKISDLVNRIEPFRFEFDGAVLEGRYYKYKTATPAYAKAGYATVPDADTIPPEKTDGTDEERALAKKVRQQAIKTRNDAIMALGFRSIADTIVEWNAEDDEGKALAPTQELFEQLPDPFTEAFIEFFNELRSPKEKKSVTSLSS